jgi:hypothetical protein
MVGAGVDARDGDVSSVVAAKGHPPFQVIALIGAESDPDPGVRSEPGLDTARMLDRVRAAVDAGADGCLVGFDLTTRPANLGWLAAAALTGLDGP